MGDTTIGKASRGCEHCTGLRAAYLSGAGTLTKEHLLPKPTEGQHRGKCSGYWGWLLGVASCAIRR